MDKKAKQIDIEIIIDIHPNKGYIEKKTIIIEVHYVGSREDAPY
jgi:hypothetical protein